MMIFVAVWGLWVVCGIASAGISFAYFQGKWPMLADKERQSDLGKSLFFGLFGGPIGLVVTFFFCEFCHYGWRLK